MSKKSHRTYWLFWLTGSGFIIMALTYLLITDGVSKSIFMPGKLSPGHHQLEDSCNVCHISKFGGGEVLQQSCIECHGDQRTKPNDSHPSSKFKDPRNADTLEKLDALRCTSCHTEHRPEITLKNGLTQPRDVCFHCHAEVAKERPSHEGMAFDSCSNSGCHNFHNNRALYTDFLVKHMDNPAYKENPHMPYKEFAAVLDEVMEYPHDRYPQKQLSLSDMDAPLNKSRDKKINHDWSETGHAKSGVNCSACHLTEKTDDLSDVWADSPSIDSCNQCHNIEVERFKLGKHGMRLQVGLSPMTPNQALLPMQPKAAHEELTCNSCHGAHRFDVEYAAVDGCLQCHADKHSLAYKKSKHFQLWQKEQTDPTQKDTGVSCASCHMPRIDYDVNDWMSRIVVDHNQSANLSPNSKMIRSSCLHCHGLGFTIDALADTALIDRNFTGSSTTHVESIELAKKDLERYLQERQSIR